MPAASSSGVEPTGESLSTSHPDSVRTRWAPSTWLGVAVVIYVLGVGMTWAAVTPPGGAPDEPSHISYAAGVVRGDLGQEVPGAEAAQRRLVIVKAPAWVNSFTEPPRSAEDFRYPCFATAPDRTANCAPPLTGSGQLEPVPTTVGRYPPLYHFIVGLPTLVMAGDAAVYAMRIVSAALAAIVIAMGLWVAAPDRRPWLALGTALAFTPTAGSLAGSINPSGLEVAAALGLGIALMGLRSDPDRPVPATPIITLVFALAWSRPLGYLAVLAVMAAAMLLNGSELRAALRRRTPGLALFAGSAVGLIGPIAYRLTLGLPARAASAVDPTTGSTLFAPIGLVDGLEHVESHLAVWGSDLIGRFGWVDHSSPQSVIVGWTVIVFTVALFVFVNGSRRDRFGLGIIGVGALVVVPLIAITTTVNFSAYEVRYHLPVAVLVVVGLAAVASRGVTERPSTTTWHVLRWGAILAPIGMVASLAGSLYRYSVGGQAQLVDLLTFTRGLNEWLPPAGALAVAAFGGALMTGAGGAALWITHRHESGMRTART